MRLPLIVPGVLLLGACASGPPPSVADHACAAQMRPASLHVPDAAPNQLNALAARGFSAESLKAAEVAGALDDLQALAAAERAPGRQGISLLLSRQALTQRVLLAVLDVHASLAALSCEDERGQQLRGQLLRRDARRSQNLGLAGLVIGGATAALSGGLSLASLSNASDMAGIIGGSLGAAVGGAQLYASSSGRLRTSTNLLDDIYRQPPQSTHFPPTVWRYLTQRPAAGEPSIAGAIVAEWRAAGLLDGEADEAMFLAREARFSADDLDRRDAMIDLVEARITLMSRDLRLLLEEVVARPTPALAGSRPRRR